MSSICEPRTRPVIGISTCGDHQLLGDFAESEGEPDCVHWHGIPFDCLEVPHWFDGTGE